MNKESEKLKTLNKDGGANCLILQLLIKYRQPTGDGTFREFRRDVDKEWIVRQ